MKIFRYQKCRCLADPMKVLARCPEHHTPIDLKPVSKASVTDDENKLQKGIAGFLELQKQAGIVERYRMNCIRFRVGEQDPWGKIREGAWFKPDFHVKLVKIARVQIYEAKGMWREAAKVRLKACAELYPEYDWWAVFEETNHTYRFQEF